jgi:hypothetical protein
MKCPRCATIIPDNSAICPKCGVHFIKRVQVVSRVPIPTPKRDDAPTLKGIGANTSAKVTNRPTMEHMIRQTRNSAIVLMVIGLILVGLIIFFITSSDWGFRDPDLTYSAIGGMIGICFGGAVLLMLKKKRLEKSLAQTRTYVIDNQKISTRKVVRTRSRK